VRTRQVVIIVLAFLVVAGMAVGGTLWLTRPGDGAVRVESYLTGPDERQLTVRFTLGIGDAVTLARFEERGDQVVVTLRSRSPEGPRNDLGLLYEMTATLVSPVSTRRIVDGSSGATVSLFVGFRLRRSR
jgi:hypothetical protein